MTFVIYKFISYLTNVGATIKNDIKSSDNL